MVEMLEGRPAFGASDPEDVFGILEAQVSEVVPRPATADEATWDLISSMIAKDPDERPTAAEVALVLGAAAEDLDTRAFSGAASALGGAAGDDQSSLRPGSHPSSAPSVQPDTTSPSAATLTRGSDVPTKNLGHRTSILRSAQTVRLGDRGSRTIALPVGLQPGSSLGSGGPEGEPEVSVTTPDGTAPRRGRRTALVVVLGLAALGGAVTLGTLLPLGEPEISPTTAPTTTG